MNINHDFNNGIKVITFLPNQQDRNKSQEKTPPKVKHIKKQVSYGDGAFKSGNNLKSPPTNITSKKSQEMR